MFVQRFPVGTERAGVLLDAAVGERDVLGHHDVPRADTLGDPVIRNVRAVRDDGLGHERMAVKAEHAAVGHEMDMNPVPFGDPDDLVLHRAGVGIDIDFEHERIEGRCGYSAAFVSEWLAARSQSVM